MAEELKLNHPWLVAVWPGMGNVAITAGYYMMAKLGMHVLAEFEAGDLFDVDHVEVKNGIIQPGRRPRNRFFVGIDPDQKRDVVVFIGEAQPPVGKFAFCRKIIEYAQLLGVEQVFTFAAMATAMRPEQRSRIFAAATDQQALDKMKRLELENLEGGHIGGLNGVLLGAAAEAGLPGTCLLGEMPHIFGQIVYPKASLAVLEIFTGLARIELDLGELAEQAQAMDQQLGEVLARAEEQFGSQAPAEEEYQPEPTAEKGLGAADQERIEKLFAQAVKDRAKAFDLKQELDRLGVFKEFEDRFLDLFHKADL